MQYLVSFLGLQFDIDGDFTLGLSRVYSDRQLNSDSDLVCFIFQILE